MRRLVGVVILVLAVCLVRQAVTAAADPPPPWAYGFLTPPPAAGTPDAPAAPAAARPAATDPTQHQVPGSVVSMTRAQVGDQFNIGDWFPSDHPKMPYIVQYGKRPDVRACGLCHLVNGKGRPENSSVSGLPVSYFLEQLNNFRNDLRKSADPRKANTNIMITIAKNLSDAEMRAAAEYFAQIPWNTPWIKVVESATVPKTRTQAGMWLSLENNESEPIGDRIMEMPVTNEWVELRDYHQEGSFVAYVPPGSVKKGEAIARSGAKVTRCSVCHGEDLQGLGPVPGIAGRSPSYTARQLYDMQQGARKGPWVSLMKPVVDKLTAEDILNVTAYVSSLPVGGLRDQRTASR
jgi:cytochrome c553